MLILLRKNDAQLISITNWKIVGEKNDTWIRSQPKDRYEPTTL